MPRKFSSKLEKKSYQAFSDAKSRCNNANHARYKDYGERGIKFLLSNFQEMVDLIGLASEGDCLDRIDNDGHYEDGNIRWTNYREQNKNKRTTTYYEYDGRNQTIEEWADEVGLPRTTLSHRIHGYGWDIATALTAPLQHKENVPDDPNKAKYLPSLDQEKADLIRKLHEAGWTQEALAKEFNVKPASIWKIVHNQSYAN
jgi:hypothetical protein